MGVIKIIGGKVINRGECTCADVIIKDGKIISVGSQNVHLPDDATIIDASGKWVSAGFIDLHTHGIAGVDFIFVYSNRVSAISFYQRHTRNICHSITKIYHI